MWLAAGGGVITALVVVGAVVLWVIPGGNAGEDDSEDTRADRREFSENESGAEQAAPGTGGGEVMPDEPCDAFSEERLADLDAGAQSENGEEGSPTCSWSVLYDDSIVGYLDLTYTEPYSETAGGSNGGEGNYEFALRFLREGQDEIREVEVAEENQLDIGDESHLVYAVETLDVLESPHAVVTALTREGEMVIEIALVTLDDESLVEPKHTDDLADLMTALSNDAVEHLN